MILPDFEYELGHAIDCNGIRVYSTLEDLIAHREDAPRAGFVRVKVELDEVLMTDDYPGQWADERAETIREMLKNEDY